MTPESLDTNPETPLLDREKLRELTAGDVDFERDLLAVYMESAPDLLSDICEAQVAQDRMTLARAAHTLKGSSRTVGSDRVADFAHNLERVSVAGDWDAIDAAVRALKACAEDLFQEVRAVIG